MKFSAETKEFLGKHKDGIGYAVFIMFGVFFTYGIRFDAPTTLLNRGLLIASACGGFLFGKFIWREGVFISLLMGFFAAVAFMYLGNAILGLAKLLFIFDLPIRVPSF